MEVHLLAIVTLVVVFALGIIRGINLGAVALGAGGILSLVLFDDGVSKLYVAFPADLFVLLVGVTFLFGIATVNGTIEWTVEALARAVRQRASAMPWMLFLIAAAVTSLGALAPVVVGLVAPIGMRMAKKNDINPRLAGLMIIHGAIAGSFSPVNLLGATVNTTLTRAGLEANPGMLYVGSLSYNLVLAVVIFFVFGGVTLVQRERERVAVVAEIAHPRVTATVGGAPGLATDSGVQALSPPDAATAEPAVPFDRVKALTLLTIATVGGLAIVAKLDLGVLALTAAVILTVITPRSSAGATKRIAWEVVLLITGVVTYVGLLNEMGTIQFVGDAANSLGSPLATAIIICLIGAVVSAFASSAGIIAVLVPLALPFLLAGQISVTGMAIALAISATVVDCTPFSTIGAVTLSSADPADRDYTYKGFLAWGALMAVTAPLLTMIFVVPSLLAGS